MTARTLNLTVGALSLLGAILIYSAATGFPDRAALMPSLISGILGFSGDSDRKHRDDYRWTKRDRTGACLPWRVS